MELPYSQIETPTADRWPVLVLVGEKETCTAKGMARRLAATIPGAVGRLVPGAGHLWNLQEPELFSATVRAWVTDEPLPPVLRPFCREGRR